jgi:hypothetical protein
MIEENFSDVIAALQERIDHRPHPEEPERSEGVSKDGPGVISLVAVLRDGASRLLRTTPIDNVEMIRTLATRR